jgi:hypothetical protein
MVLIDSGASSSFISERYARQQGIATRAKQQGYELVAVDGSNLLGVNRETVPVSVCIDRHQVN